MGLIRKLLINKYTTIFTTGLLVGAISGSGILSKDYNSKNQKQIIVQDKQGIEYKVDLEKHSIESLTNNYQTKQNNLTKLLR